MWRTSVGAPMVLVASTLLVGCGEAVAGAPGREPRPSAAIEQEVHQLYELTWGSPLARQALEVLAYVEFHEGVADCLQAEGLRHVAGPFLDATDASPPPAGWQAALLPVDEGAASLRGFETPDVVAAEVRPGKRWDGRAASASEQSACEEKVQMRAPGPLDPELDAELHRLVDSRVAVTPSAGDGRYRQCMESLGHDVREDRDSFVTSFVNRRLAPNEATAAERRAAVADARCRTEAHRDLMQSIDQPLQKFRSANVDRLAELEQRPEQLQAEARSAAARVDLRVDWL